MATEAIHRPASLTPGRGTYEALKRYVAAHRAKARAKARDHEATEDAFANLMRDAFRS